MLFWDHGTRSTNYFPFYDSNTNTGIHCCELVLNPIALIPSFAFGNQQSSSSRCASYERKAAICLIRVPSFPSHQNQFTIDKSSPILLLCIIMYHLVIMFAVQTGKTGKSLLFVESDPKYPIGEENFDIMGGGLRASV
jgi:hypothetical protein